MNISIVRPNVYRYYTFSSLRELNVSEAPFDFLAPPPARKKDIDAYSYNIKSRALGVLGYSLCSLADFCCSLFQKISLDTRRLRRIEETEKALLETHFSELNSDVEGLSRGITNVTRFIPFIHAPVSLLVNAAAKTNHENLKFLEKCSKVALTALSFVPKMAFKGCYKITTLFQKCIRYPKSYCYSVIQNPDIVDSAVSSLCHRVASVAFSIKRAYIHPHFLPRHREERISFDAALPAYAEAPDQSKGYLEEIQFLAGEELGKTSLDEGSRELWRHILTSVEHHLLNSTGALPFQEAGFKKIVQKRLEEGISSQIATHGVFFSGIHALGSCSNRIIQRLGKTVAFPFMRAGKPGRYDLKMIVAVALKSLELFLASDKGSALTATYLGKVLPLQSVENTLQYSIGLLVHFPMKILTYLGDFQEQLKAARALPGVTGEFKLASERSIQELNQLKDTWKEYCFLPNYRKEMCSLEMFQLLNSTQFSLVEARDLVFSTSTALFERVVPEIEKKMGSIHEALPVAFSFWESFRSFFGNKELKRKFELLSIKKLVVQAGEHEIEIAGSLRMLKEVQKNAFLMSRTATAVDRVGQWIFPFLHIQWIAQLIESSNTLLTSYGAPLLKFSLLGYDINEKLTETKKKLILSSQHVSQEALTKADIFVRRSSFDSGWFWTLKFLKMAVPAGITLAMGSSTTLTTKLMQIVLPQLVVGFNPIYLRNLSECIGRELPVMARRGGNSVQQVFSSLASSLQAKWNLFRGHFDTARLEGLQNLPLIHRITLLELIQQSRSIPEALQKKALDISLKRKFLSVESRWSVQEWTAYCQTLLSCYNRITEQEKAYVTPLLFLSLPENMQTRIASLVPGASVKSDLLWLSRQFNGLSANDKQKIHSLSVDEFLQLSKEIQNDIFAVLALSTQKTALSGKTAYEKYISCQKLSREQLKSLLPSFSTISKSELAILTPSQARRLRPDSLSRVIDLLFTYKRASLDELCQEHEGISCCSNFQMIKSNLIDVEVIDHIAILFSSLSMNERGQLLSLTHEELSSMLHSEQSHFLGVFQAHIQEWIDKGKASGIFSYGKEEKIQPCLDFVSSLIKKLMSKEAEPPLKLTTKEADVVLSYFNSTEMIFRSDCRMHSEEEIGCMTEKEVLIILKEIETIDALYKTGMKSIVKIQLSAGHFLKEALNIEKAMQERASKGFLNYLEREESVKAIALNQAAKSQRLLEIEQYQVILNHLRNKREERTNLLELQQCPLPPFPILKEEEIRDIIGIFSPLVEEFKESESSLLQEIFEKTLMEKASAEERCVYARAVLDHNINEIHIAEEHVRNKQPEGSFSQDSDAQILSLYKKYISGEIDLFILSFAQKKRALYLSSIKKLHISLPEVV